MKKSRVVQRFMMFLLSISSVSQAFSSGFFHFQNKIFRHEKWFLSSIIYHRNIATVVERKKKLKKGGSHSTASPYHESESLYDASGPPFVLGALAA